MKKKPLVLGCGFLLLAVLGLLGAGTWYLYRGLVQEPVEVQALALQILPIEIPEGLIPRFGWDRSGYRAAFFQGVADDDLNELVVASVPTTSDGELDADWSISTQKDWQKNELEMVEDGTFEVQVTNISYLAEMSIGTNSEGVRYRAIRLHIPVGEGSIEVFRVGPATLVTQESFRALFP
jgi:hypothetical protein